MGAIWLVRHGQASFGAEDYDVLSPTGWQQGAALAEFGWAGGLPRFDRVVRGGMRRHAETLEAMQPGLRANGTQAEADIDERFNEFDHLAVVAAYPDQPEDGLHSLDHRGFQALFEVATQRWFAGDRDEDYNESFASFTLRAREALREVAGQTGSGEHALVVTSGGVIAIVAALLVGDGSPAITAQLFSTFNTTCVNTGVTKLITGSRGVRLVSFNEHPHLTPELRTYR